MNDETITALLEAAVAYQEAWRRLEKQAWMHPHTRAHWAAHQGVVVAGHTLASAALHYADAVATPPAGAGEEAS